ncbi:MAG TPA: GNAT family N-acetyltransferase [Marmoricola sp.]|nr:GNAT family N-acetyltransferase [Marmoricola sp.]
MNDQVVTSHNQARSRFEAHVSGELASYLEYRRNGSIHDLVHTYTLDAFKGRGIATTLTGFALASIRESGTGASRPGGSFGSRTSWITWRSRTSSMTCLAMCRC